MEAANHGESGGALRPMEGANHGASVGALRPMEAANHGASVEALRPMEAANHGESVGALRPMEGANHSGQVMANSYEELWCLLNWAVPGCLGEKRGFTEYYSRAMKQGQRHGANDKTFNLGRKRGEQLKRILDGLLKRRTKEVTLQDSPDFQLLVRAEELCDCGSREYRAKCCHCRAPEGVLWRQLHCCECDKPECKNHRPDGCSKLAHDDGTGNVSRGGCPFCLTLPALTILRKICNHLELVKAGETMDPEKDARDTEVARMVLGEDAVELGGVALGHDFLTLSGSLHCGKMMALEQLLALWKHQPRAKHQGDKVLIFSHSVRMLSIVERMLVRRGYIFSRLDGSTAERDRRVLVEEFNNTPSKFIFLISTRAGGLGLNLTSANRVVVFDPNWNPALDLQAQDRAFRIGQQRHVSVYRLVAAGSLEEIIYTRQLYKQQQSNIAVTGAYERRYFEAVQGDKSHKGELFGIRNLFKLSAEEVQTKGLMERGTKPELAYVIQVAALPTPPISQLEWDVHAKHDEGEEAAPMPAE
eukprot:gene26519-32549_t